MFRLGVPCSCKFLCLLVVGVLAVGCASTRSDPTNFNDLFNEARTSFAQGDTKKAERLFYKSVQLLPRHPYPHYYLGIIYADQGDTELAIVAFEKAIELEPNFHEAIYNLGTMHLERRELPSAIRLFERALEIDPTHVPTFNNLGKAYYMAGYPDMAGAAYEEALALDPDNEVALESLFLLAQSAGAEEAAAEYRGRLDRIQE